MVHIDGNFCSNNVWQGYWPLMVIFLRVYQNFVWTSSQMFCYHIICGMVINFCWWSYCPLMKICSIPSAFLLKCYILEYCFMPFRGCENSFYPSPILKSLQNINLVLSILPSVRDLFLQCFLAFNEILWKDSSLWRDWWLLFLISIQSQQSGIDW